jgi:hypothetical protein
MRKYIFVAGAPGSKWSSVVKNIYFSPSVDQTDYSEERTYWHDASGAVELMHLGAYFDPGMEFGKFFDDLGSFSKEDCEREFDKPFNGEGVRIIKSHVFAHHIDFIKENWPDCPIVLVHRPDDACLGWWIRCGQFEITYPKYDQYYKDLRTMSFKVDEQNKDIRAAWDKYKVRELETNIDLTTHLNIERPPERYWQNYKSADVQVGVI